MTAEFAMVNSVCVAEEPESNRVSAVTSSVTQQAAHSARTRNPVGIDSSCGDRRFRTSASTRCVVTYDKGMSGVTSQARDAACSRRPKHWFFVFIAVLRLQMGEPFAEFLSSAEQAHLYLWHAPTGDLAGFLVGVPFHEHQTHKESVFRRKP